MKLDQSKAPVLEALERMKTQRLVPFDVPGHKRGKGNPDLTAFLGEKCLSVDVNSMKMLDNLCHPVSVIKEAEELAVRSEAMIVIGGTNSSNSRKLFDICKNQCENTYFIQTAEDLSSIDLSSFASLGITAGASTPNTIIQEVLRACQKI